MALLKVADLQWVATGAALALIASIALSLDPSSRPACGVLAIYTLLDGGSLHPSGHAINLRANRAQASQATLDGFDALTWVLFFENRGTQDVPLRFRWRSWWPGKPG